MTGSRSGSRRDAACRTRVSRPTGTPCRARRRPRAERLVLRAADAAGRA